MNKSHTFLTNPKYAQVVEAVHLSPQPVTAKEILAKCGDVKDKDIYRIIKELVPIREPAKLLFEWNKITDKNNWYKYVTVCRLNKYFKLGWDTTRIYQDCVEGNIEFIKNHERDKLTIEYGRQILEIELKKGQENSRFVAVLRIKYLNSKNEPTLAKSYDLIFTKKRNDLFIQMIQSIPPIKYLLPMDVKEDIKSLNKHWHDFRQAFDGYPRHPNICDISKVGRVDRENWKYRPNIRGLLLYIIVRINSEAKDGLNDKNRRAYDHRISNILKNLSANYFVDFPFLLHYKTEFETKFDLLAKHGYIPENFFIKSIKEIAEQLRNSLDKLSLEDLTYHVTKRYYEEINAHFRSGIVNDDGLPRPTKFELLSLVPDLNISLHKVIVNLYPKIIEYFCIIGSYITEEEKKKLDNFNDDLNVYYEENEFLRLRNELETKFISALNSNTESIPPIISFYELLDNSPIIALNPTDHRNNIIWRIVSKLSSVLQLMVAHISGFEAAGLCVIHKPVFDDLKSKLSKSNRPLVEAPSLLIDKGIPEACHSFLLSKMGFK